MRATAPPPSPEAGVIKDARARQRRERLGVCAVLLAAVTAAAVAGGTGGGGGGRPAAVGDASPSTPIGHAVGFRSARGRAQASFTRAEPAGVILLAQISVPHGARAFAEATNPYGGATRIATPAGRPGPSLSCSAHGQSDICTQAEEACPLIAATWRFHIVKLSGPPGPIRVTLVVGPRPTTRA